MVTVTDPDVPLVCPGCGEDFVWALADLDATRRRWFYEAHLKTFAHQAGTASRAAKKLGSDAGEELKRVVSERRDRILRWFGLIP